MAKRFRDSKRHEEKWWRKLPLRSKVLIDYLEMACNNAGIIEIDYEFYSSKLGEIITQDDILPLIQIGRVEKINNDFIWLPLFVFEQVNDGKLSPKCGPHKKIIKQLEEFNLLQRVMEGLRNSNVTLTEGLGNSTSTLVQSSNKGNVNLQEEEEEEYKEEEGEKEEEEEEEKLTPEQKAGKLQCTVIEEFNQILGGTGKIKLYKGFFMDPVTFDKFTRLLGDPEFSDIEKIKNYFAMVKNIPALTGLVKKGEWSMQTSFLWFMDGTNARKVLSGHFAEGAEAVEDDVNWGNITGSTG